LMMLILIGIVPAKFALDERVSMSSIAQQVATAEEALAIAESDPSTIPFKESLVKIRTSVQNLQSLSNDLQTDVKPPAFEIRKNIILLRNETKHLKSNPSYKDSIAMQSLVSKSDLLKSATDYSPTWVIVLIALSLGIGTMIGWKRIVVTIGEKIGKSHLTYAQGASAEIVAASTIAASTYLGLPVSTTHVLSSGIAGSMFASGGVNNLERSMITKILLAWVLTLPVCVTMSGALFLIFRTIFG
jgi:inorganic phosphate transporter, PiT family